jgi:hypothetical protein
VLIFQFKNRFQGLEIFYLKKKSKEIEKIRSKDLQIQKSKLLQTFFRASFQKIAPARFENKHISYQVDSIL